MKKKKDLKPKEISCISGGLKAVTAGERIKKLKDVAEAPLRLNLMYGGPLPEFEL